MITYEVMENPVVIKGEMFGYKVVQVNPNGSRQPVGWTHSTREEAQSWADRVNRGEINCKGVDFRKGARYPHPWVIRPIP